MPSEETAVRADAQPPAGPSEAQDLLGITFPGNEDTSAEVTSGGEFQKDGRSDSEMPAVEKSEAASSPGEPVPSSVIDYVLRKRRRQP